MTPTCAQPASAAATRKTGRHLSVSRFRAWATPFIANPVFYFTALTVTWVVDPTLRATFINPLLKPLAQNSVLWSVVHRFVNDQFMDSVFIPAAVACFVGVGLVVGRWINRLAEIIRPVPARQDGRRAARLLDSRTTAVVIVIFWQTVFFGWFIAGGWGMLWALSAAWLGVPLVWGMLRLAGKPIGAEDLNLLHFKLLPIIGFLLFLQTSLFLEIYVPPFRDKPAYKDGLDIPAYFVSYLLLMAWWLRAKARCSFTSLRNRVIDLLYAVSREPAAAGWEIATEVRLLDSIVRAPRNSGSISEARWGEFKVAYRSLLERLVPLQAASGLNPQRFMRGLERRDAGAYALIGDVAAALKSYRKSLRQKKS